MFVEEDELERNKQLLELRTSVLEAEEDRLSGQPTMSISEARKALDKSNVDPVSRTLNKKALKND